MKRSNQADVATVSGTKVLRRRSKTAPFGEGTRLRLLGTLGANKVMAGELSRLVRRAYTDVWVPDPHRHGDSAISYPFEPRLAVVAAKYHRTSARVLWDLYRSEAGRLEPLYDDLIVQIRRFLPRCFSNDAGFSVTVRGVEGFPAGPRQVVGTVKNALIDGAKRQGITLNVEPTEALLQIDVRRVDSEIVVALDLAGRPMHLRGYRTVAGAAPIREDLAANLVMLARHDARAEVLIDPMAGSGTIGIEAACMASARGNWCQGRRPAIDGFSDFAEWTRDDRTSLFADTTGLVLLNEAEPELARGCLVNARAAGVSDSISCRVGSFQTWQADELLARAAKVGLHRGLILCNPPYGERLSDGTDMRDLYGDLSRWCSHLPGFRAAFIVANPGFESAFGRRPRIKKPLKNGPLDSYFYLFDP